MTTRQLFWPLALFSAICFWGSTLQEGVKDTAAVADRPGVFYDSHSSGGPAQPLQFIFGEDIRQAGRLAVSFDVLFHSNPGNYPNLFQTADGNSGLRMELSPEGVLSVIAGRPTRNEFVSWEIKEKPAIGTWYPVRAEISPEIVRVLFNGRQVMAAMDGINVALEHFAAGNGFNGARGLDGSLRNLHVAATKPSLVGPAGRISALLFPFAAFAALLAGFLGWKEKVLPRLLHAERRAAPLIPIAGILVAAGLLWALFICRNLPIYFDEIGYQQINARAVADHFRIFNTAYVFCGDGIAMPLAWRPAQWMLSVIYDHVVNLRLLRWLGIIKALLAAGAISLLFTLMLRGRTFSGWKVSAFFAGGLSLGILPAMLALNRPEPALLTCLAWLVAAPLLANSGKRPFGGAVFAAGQAIAVMFLFPLHAKSVFFAPLAVLSTFSVIAAFLGKKAASLCAALVLAAAAQSYLAYSANSACPRSPVIARSLSNSYLTPSQANLGKPLSFAGKLVMNIADSPAYPYKAGFQADYFPGIILPPTNPAAVSILAPLHAGIHYLFFGLAAVTIFFLILHLKAGTPLLGGNGRNLAPFLLALGLLGLATVQVNKAFYESLFFFGVLMMTGLSAYAIAEGNGFEKLPHILLTLLLPCALASLLAFHLLENERMKAPFGGGGVSLNSYDHEAKAAEIKTLMGLCSLSDAPDQKHLLLDDTAYMSFKHTSEPYNLSYFRWAADTHFGMAVGQNPPQLLSLAKQAGVSGLVARCWRFHYNTRQAGDMCCLSAEDIARYAAPPADGCLALPIPGNTACQSPAR